MVNTFGVTNVGFVKKSFTEIIQDLEATARRNFGQDVDLTPGSPIKILIDMFALQFAGMWNEMEQCYKASFVNTATDDALDNLAMLVGVERLQGYAATSEITFFRTTVLPDGSPRIIPAGTVVSSTHINPLVFTTTRSVYFEPTISNEEHAIKEDTDSFDCVNFVGSITSITDSDANNLTVGATFSGKTVTLAAPVLAGKSVFVTYKPLSVTAPIKAKAIGSDYNVPANTITVMSNPINFVHYISNEGGIDSGYDVESDSNLRGRIVGASQSVGKATRTSLEYFLSRVSGVTNVTVEDPWTITTTEEIPANGMTTFYTTNHPLHSVTSVEGSVSGPMTVSSFTIDTGAVILTEPTVNGETLTVVYTYTNPGNIKVYVEGGEVGDENTEDTIVYTIENTRAAGIRSVGYGAGDENAFGSPSAPFSWFYRPSSAEIDVALTVYFDDVSTLSASAKATVVAEITAAITEFINSLDIKEKLYRNRLLQLAISANSDIVDAQLDSWSINGISQPVDAVYIQGAEMEIPIARTINITTVTE